jgi:hypothetical protein
MIAPTAAIVRGEGQRPWVSIALTGLVLNHSRLFVDE